MPRVKIDSTQPAAASPTTSSTQPATVPTPPAPDEIDQELKDKSGSEAFSAFVAFPAGVSTSITEEGEEIILLLRAHIVTNVPWILVTILLLIGPLVLFPLLTTFGVLPNLGVGAGLVFTLLWYLGTFTYAFINFLYWYFNVYLVTTERIVDVDWYSVIYRRVSSTQIAKIQDVSSTQAGVLAGIFDFGNVQIQTAGEEENFEFTAVPHPQLVAKKIQKLMQEEEGESEHNP